MDDFQIPVLPCMCANLRRAARAVTHLYEQELRPAGLTSAQFTILQTLSIAGGVTQGQLGKILVMDSTSLTRTLAIMSSHGWLEKRPGQDRRERRLRLSRAGEKHLSAALPHWNRAQMRLQEALGRSRSAELSDLMGQIANTISAATSKSGVTQ
jgi:DNA-binding MarR family transcriptional regulator